MSYIHKMGTSTFRYERKRICDEMPALKLKSKKWFLWEWNAGKWDYLGYFDTQKQAETYAETVYKKIAAKNRYCRKCAQRRTFHKESNGRYHCEHCGDSLPTWGEMKRASQAGFNAYAQHVHDGQGGNERAVAAGQDARHQELDAATFDEAEQGMFLQQTGRR